MKGTYSVAVPCAQLGVSASGYIHWRGWSHEGQDHADASKVASAVHGFPEKHRLALNLLYVGPGSPIRICKAVEVSMQGLFDLIVTGRQMLINWGM